MIVIKTLADLRSLRQRETLPGGYVRFIEQEFHGLMEALRGDVNMEDFSLQEHGYIVILLPNDDVRNLKSVGLNPKDGGLLGCSPEYIETYEIGEILRLRKIAVLFDNEFMMFFVSEVGIFDEVVEEWLDERTDYIVRENSHEKRE